MKKPLSTLETKLLKNPSSILTQKFVTQILGGTGNNNEGTPEVT